MYECNYGLFLKNRSLLTRLNRETARLMKKDDLGGKINVQLVAFQPPMYRYKA